MEQTKHLLKLLLIVVFVTLVIMSFTTVQTLRQSADNKKSLDFIERCVLPEGDLCKGSSDTSQKLVDEIVERINEHTDSVVK